MVSFSPWSHSFYSWISPIQRRYRPTTQSLIIWLWWFKQHIGSPYLLFRPVLSFCFEVSRCYRTHLPSDTYSQSLTHTVSFLHPSLSLSLSLFPSATLSLTPTHEWSHRKHIPSTRNVSQVGRGNFNQLFLLILLCCCCSLWTDNLFT